MKFLWVMFVGVCFFTGMLIAGIQYLTPSVTEFAMDELGNGDQAELGLSDYDIDLRKKLLPLVQMCRTCRQALEFTESYNSDSYPIVATRLDPQTKTTYMVVVGVITLRKVDEKQIRRPISRVRSRREYYVCAPTGYCEIYNARTGLAYVTGVDGVVRPVGKQSPENIQEIHEVFYKNFLQ